MIKSILSDTEMKNISKLQLAVAGSPAILAIELNSVIKNLLLDEHGINVVQAVLTYNSGMLIDYINLEDPEFHLLLRRIEKFDKNNTCN